MGDAGHSVAADTKKMKNKDIRTLWSWLDGVDDEILKESGAVVQ